MAKSKKVVESKAHEKAEMKILKKMVAKDERAHKEMKASKKGK